MTAQVFSFARRASAPCDWTPQELAEFYRVEAALIQAGLRAVSARGMTDEGDPWFVFCRAEDDEVIVHFARIGGRFVISAPAYCGSAEGTNFQALVRSIVERHPVLRPRPGGNNLFLHPAAMLTALVASALLKSGHSAEAAQAKPATPDVTIEVRYRGVTLSSPPQAGKLSDPLADDAHRETVVLAALAAILASPLHDDAVVAHAASAPTAAPDLEDFAPAWHASVPLADARDLAPVGSGSTPAPIELQPVPLSAGDQSAAPSGHAAFVSDTPTHAAPQADDAGLAVHAGVFSQTFQVSGFEPVISVTVLPDPDAGVQHVSLSSLTGIPKADLDLLRALGVGDTVSYVSVVPPAISAVLQDGVHTTASRTPAPEHAAAHDSASHSSSPPPASNAPSSTPQAANAAASPPPAPDATDPSNPGAGPSLSMSDVLQMVQKFQATEAHPTVIMTDHSAIFYDAGPVSANLPAVQSVTYDFGDGFSISLVGLPNELAQAGVHVS